jgi:hypothetical protein
MMTVYAKLSWCAEDVRTLAPTLTLKQAEDWLANNEKYIRDRLTELGWGVMETLLQMDGISLEDGEEDISYADRRIPPEVT